MEYPNNLDCVHDVPIPRGMALKITFKDFLLEDPFWIGYWFVDESLLALSEWEDPFFGILGQGWKRRGKPSCNLGQPKLSLN